MVDSIKNKIVIISIKNTLWTLSKFILMLRIIQLHYNTLDSCCQPSGNERRFLGNKRYIFVIITKCYHDIMIAFFFGGGRGKRNLCGGGLPVCKGFSKFSPKNYSKIFKVFQMLFKDYSKLFYVLTFLLVSSFFKALRGCRLRRRLR